ncbi:MAG: glycoside hydrolase family 99-like domain-containing protein [Clostridiales bacterium]|nr:glycoside hydrolase family 99-like domain-containing protein [Clostridiales bacterium]
MKKKIISMFVIVNILMSVLTPFAFSASEKIVMQYTFDSESSQEYVYDTSTGATAQFKYFDGMSYPFVFQHTGWNSYFQNGEGGGRYPNAEQMYIEGGSLCVNMLGHERLAVNIPVNETGNTAKHYQINFVVKHNSATAGQGLKIAMDELPSVTSPSKYEAVDVTEARPGGMHMYFDTVGRSHTYSKVVYLSPGQHSLRFQPIGNVNFKIEEIIVKELEGESAAPLDFMLPGGQYLIEDDMFYSIGTPGGSGWDVHEAGGEVSSQWGRYYLKDTNKYLSVDMKHDFKSVDSGRFAVDYRFYFTDDIDGFKWQIRNGETPVISLKTMSGAIYAQTPSQDVYLCDYTVDEQLAQNYTPGAQAEYGVKIFGDFDTKTYDVYINGKLCGDDIALSGECVDNVFFSSSDAETGCIYIYPLRVYTDYYVNETFVSTKSGSETVPSYFVKSGNASVVHSSSQLWFDQYSLRLQKNENEQAISLQNDFEIEENTAAFEFFVIDSVGNSKISASLGDGIKISTDNNCFKFGDEIFYSNYVTNLWYRIKVIADFKEGVCDLYVNDILQKGGMYFSGNNKGIKFECAQENAADVMLDDIFVYPMLEEPADYVPEPNKAESKQDVGIISCSLWRPGKQMGWDRIAPYPERKPLLGYYDEGNPEVSDWETKMMVEHGADFQMFCWFKPNGTQNTPIKTPNWSYALENGYKNSKYSDMMKYCILFENLTASIEGADDFKNNIVPYWIEHYFKDERYYKIDNKPVISIYNLKKFVQQVNAIYTEPLDEHYTSAKNVLDYLREKCKEAGFDGAVIMSCSASYENYIDPARLTELGIDAVHPYGWDGADGASALYMKNMSERMAGYGIDLVTGPGMGMDKEPWDGVKGQMTTKASFEEQLNWTINEYMPNIAVGQYGKNMVVIDNWNEIGEGHYICPSEGNGWDYLDIMRKYLCPAAPEHSDAVPTANQAKRIQIMYDQNRTGYKQVNNIVPERYSDNIVKSWDFELSNSGWTNDHLEKSSVTGGAWYLKAAGDDPWIKVTDLSIPAEDVSYIKLRLKRSSQTPCKAELYFLTDEYTEIDWNRRYSFIVQEGDWADYYINVASNEYWKGTIKGIRFDPFNGKGGEMWIDEITLIGNLTNPQNSIAYKNEIIPIEPTIIDSVPMVPLVSAAKTIKDAKFEWETDKKEKLTFVCGKDAYEVCDSKKGYRKNGVVYKLNHPFKLKDGIMYAPIDFLGELTAPYGVSYIENKNAVSVGDNAGIDYNAPVIVSSYPVYGESLANANVKPYITFDKAVSESSIAQIVIKKGDVVIPSQNTLSADGKTVTLTPKNGLSEHTSYRIVVPDTVCGENGAAVSEAEYPFSTALMCYDFEKEPTDTLKNEYSILSQYLVTCKRTNETASGGEYSFKVAVGSPEGGNIKFGLPILEDQQYKNRTYTVSLDLKGLYPGMSKTLSFYISYYTDGRLVNKQITNLYKLKDDFETYKFTFSIEDEPAGVWLPQLYILSNAAGGGFYIDNLKMSYTNNDIGVLSNEIYMLKGYGSDNEEYITEDNITSGEITAVADKLYREGESYILVIAKYNEGRLISVKTDRIEASEDKGLKQKKLTASLSADASSNDEIKAFLWNTQDFTPQSSVVGMK